MIYPEDQSHACRLGLQVGDIAQVGDDTGTDIAIASMGVCIGWNSTLGRISHFSSDTWPAAGIFFVFLLAD
jgi:hypothetical protein